MNGLTQKNCTLGELLTELKARLGFIAQGPASNSNNPVLISFLREAHEYVYVELTPPPLRKITAITLEAGSYLYDWHNDIDDEDIAPYNVLSIRVKKDSNETEVKEGISNEEREDRTRGTVEKYDILNGQIEVWPVPDVSHELIIEYIASPSRFAQMTDRPSVPDRLLFTYALANAKTHFRHNDAQAAASTFANMLRAEKVRQKGNKRYFVSEKVDSNRNVKKSGDTYIF